MAYVSPTSLTRYLCLFFQEAEKEYQRKLQNALERPQSEKLHPSRRRTMERYGGSAR